MPGTDKATAEALKVGVNHERVGHLQNRLSALGHSASDPPGTFGPKTHLAVVAFQEKAGLAADGIVGPKTTEALRGGDTLNHEHKAEAETAKAAKGAPAAKGAAKDAAKPKAAAGDSRRYARKIEIDHNGLVRVYYRGGGSSAAGANAGGEAATAALAEAEAGKPGTNWKQVGPEARKRINPIVRHYMKMAHPFTACVRDNAKRFGEDRANRICAVVKDMGMRSTKWRKGPKKVTEAEAVEAMTFALVEACDFDLAAVSALEEYLLDELASGGRPVVWLDETAPVAVHALVLEEANAGYEALIAKLVAAGVPEQQAKAIVAKGKTVYGGGKHRGGTRTHREIRRLANGNFAPKGRGKVLIPGDKVLVPSKDGNRMAPATVGQDGKFSLEAGRDKGWQASVHPDSFLRGDEGQRAQVEGENHGRLASGRDVPTSDGRQAVKPSAKPAAKNRAANRLASVPMAERESGGFRVGHRVRSTVTTEDNAGARGKVTAIDAEGRIKVEWGDGTNSSVGPNELAAEGSAKAAAKKPAASARSARMPNGTEIRIRQPAGGTGWIVERKDATGNNWTRDRAGVFTDESGAREHMGALASGGDRASVEASVRRMGGRPRRDHGTQPGDPIYDEHGMDTGRRVERAKPKASPSRAEREAAAAAAHPIGSTVSTTVHSGTGSERVTGKVVGHRRGSVQVRTENHGTLDIDLDKVERGSAKASPKVPEAERLPEGRIVTVPIVARQGGGGPRSASVRASQAVRGRVVSDDGGDTIKITAQGRTVEIPRGDVQPVGGRPRR